MKRSAISVALSVLVLIWCLAGLIYPAVGVNPVVLIVIAFINLPWLARRIESIELPGGVRIRFRATPAEDPDPNPPRLQS